MIIAKSAWEPPKPPWPADTRSALRVAAQEREVRQPVKAADGKWKPKAVVWELSYGHVVALGLTERHRLYGSRGAAERSSTNRGGQIFVERGEAFNICWATEDTL